MLEAYLREAVEALPAKQEIGTFQTSLGPG